MRVHTPRHVILICLALIAGGVCSVCLSGCFPEPTTTSPISGREVTLGQYTYEDQEARRKAQAEAKAAQDKAQAEIDTATRDAKLKMTRAGAASAVEQAQIQNDLDAAVQHATQLSGSALADLNARLTSLDDSKVLAGQQIAKNRQAVLDAWGIAKPLLGMIPGYGAMAQDAGDKAVNSWAGIGGALTGAAGLATAAVQTMGKRKAQAETEASNRRGRAMVNHVDTLRSDPKVKEAMKSVDPVVRAKAAAQLAVVPGALDLLHSESVT